MDGWIDGGRDNTSDDQCIELRGSPWPFGSSTMQSESSAATAPLLAEARPGSMLKPPAMFKLTIGQIYAHHGQSLDFPDAVCPSFSLLSVGEELKTDRRCSGKGSGSVSHSSLTWPSSKRP